MALLHGVTKRNSRDGESLSPQTPLAPPPRRCNVKAAGLAGQSSVVQLCSSPTHIHTQTMQPSNVHCMTTHHDHVSTPMNQSSVWSDSPDDAVALARF